MFGLRSTRTRHESPSSKVSMSQKKLRDIGQSQEKKDQGCDEVEGTDRYLFHECFCWKEIREQQ